MGAVAWIFSARHDAHPFGGMFFVGIGWPNHLNNTLSYSGYCQEECGGQSKVHAHAANCSKTITHIQIWNFSLNIGYSVVGFFSKVLVPYCGISGFIDMAWGVCRRVFVDTAYTVVMSKMISSESLNQELLKNCVI